LYRAAVLASELIAVDDPPSEDNCFMTLEIR
jgi:hypothetical protein